MTDPPRDVPLTEPYASLVRDLSAHMQYYHESAVKHRRLTLGLQRASTSLGVIAVALLAIKAGDVGSGLSDWLANIGAIRSDGSIARALALVDRNVAFPAIVAGAVAAWISGFAERRGYIRAWTRSAVLRTRLDAAMTDIRTLARLDAYDDPAKKAVRREEAARISIDATKLAVSEAEHWKAEMTRDFGRVAGMFRNAPGDDA